MASKYTGEDSPDVRRLRDESLDRSPLSVALSAERAAKAAPYSAVDMVAVTDPPSSAEKSNSSLGEIKSVWDFTEAVKLNVAEVEDTTKVIGWLCNYCGESKSGKNATKALAHIAKVDHPDVKKCVADIPAEKLQVYRSFWSCRQEKKQKRKQVVDATAAAVAGRQEGLATSLERQKSAAKKQKIRVASRTSSLAPVCAAAETQLTIAIADFVYSRGLAFNLTNDNPYFDRVLTLARCVPSSYTPPSRNELSGRLLDLCYNQKIEELVKKLVSDGDKFGLAFYGDGATVRKLPLMNIMASCVRERAAVLEIHDCSGHLAEGGSKDAEYVANIFKPHIEKVDPKGMCDCRVFAYDAGNSHLYFIHRYSHGPGNV